MGFFLSQKSWARIIPAVPKDISIIIKRLCCCKESLMDRMICKKGLVSFLLTHRTRAFSACSAGLKFGPIPNAKYPLFFPISSYFFPQKMKKRNATKKKKKKKKKRKNLNVPIDPAVSVTTCSDYTGYRLCILAISNLHK